MKPNRFWRSGLPFKPNGGQRRNGMTGLSLPDLFPTSFPGVQDQRDSFLVDIDLDRLKQTHRAELLRVTDLRHDEIARDSIQSAMRDTSSFKVLRCALLQSGEPTACFVVVRHEAAFIRCAHTAHSTTAGSTGRRTRGLLD